MEIGVLSLKRKSLDASMDVFTVGPERAREAVRQRFQAELVAVRRLLQKARCEGPPAKRSKKASPSVTVIQAPRKKMTLGEREMVAADLAGLAAQLPDDIVEFLEKQSCGIGGGEMEIDIHALQDDAMVELQQKLDMFARKKVNPSVQEHAKMTPEEEEEEDVDIVGGVSPLAIAPAPLQLAEEEEEHVDICGDASPVARQKKLGDDESISGSPSSSSDSDSDSGSDSSDSGSDSSSDSSDSESEEDESVDSPAPAERVGTPPITELIAHAKESLERQRKEARSKAREKARQEVLETERRAMPDETIHPTVLQSLRIVDQYNRPSPYNLLRRLGLFLKADNYDIQERHHHHPRHRQIFQEDLEEGEIRV